MQRHTQGSALNISGNSTIYLSDLTCSHRQHVCALAVFHTGIKRGADLVNTNSLHRQDNTLKRRVDDLRWGVLREGVIEER